jgi:hypothetical protein
MGMRRPTLAQDLAATDRLGLWAAEKREQAVYDRGVIVGIALACSTIHGSFDQPTMVAEALRTAGLDRRKCVAAGVSPYDLKVLRPVFKELRK